MVKIASPVSERDDVGELPRIFVQQLAETNPELLREFGCGVLADRAVAAYEKNCPTHLPALKATSGDMREHWCKPADDASSNLVAAPMWLCECES